MTDLRELAARDCPTCHGDGKELFRCEESDCLGLHEKDCGTCAQTLAKIREARRAALDEVAGRYLAAANRSPSFGKARQSETCVWQEDEDGNWQTTCDRVFVMITDDLPSEASMVFCCYCGKSLEERPYVPEEEE